MWHKKFLVFLSLFGIGISVNIPSSFETCKRSDSDLNGCLKRAIEKALPILEKGVPEINFSPTYSVFIPSLTIGEGKGSAVHVVQNFKNVSIFNFFSYPNIENVDAKIKDDSIDLTLDTVFKEVKVDSQYDFNGRILVLPIVGNGACKIIFYNVKSHIVMHGEEIKKKDEAYYDIKDLTVKLFPEKIHFEFDNLFNGDKALGDEMNKILNENWAAIWDDVKEAYELTISLIFKNLASIIFKKIPHKEIFP